MLPQNIAAMNVVKTSIVSADDRKQQECEQSQTDGKVCVTVITYILFNLWVIGYGYCVKNSYDYFVLYFHEFKTRLVNIECVAVPLHALRAFASIRALTCCRWYVLV